MWKVLIADDEPKIRQGLRKTLEGFSFPLEIVAEAKNGLDAFKKAKELAPDILLVDICMPKLNGIDFLRKLKELQLLPLPQVYEYDVDTNPGQTIRVKSVPTINK